MWLLLSTLICGLLKVSGQYKLVENVGTWTDANTSCILARPDINWYSQENPVELDENGKAWIGYAISFDIFQYIGCVLVQDLTSSSINYTAIQTRPGPGHCSHVCRNSTMFGLRIKNTGQTDCFCFENRIGDINKTRNDCSVSCNKNDRFLCGNTASLSLYSKVQINEPSTDKERCLTIKDGHYNWKKCDAEHHPACFKDVNDTSSTSNGHNMTWKDAMNECIKINQFPMTTEHDSKSLKNKEYWTAYVNAGIIIDNENQPVNTSEETIKHQESDAQESGDSKAGIYMYVSIPLVFLMCVWVAIVLLIWYKKRHGRKKTDLTLSTRSNHCYDESNYDELCYENITEENDGKQTNKLQVSEDDSKIANTLADMHYESIDSGEPAAGIYDFALDMNNDTANKNTVEPSYFVLEKVEKPPEVSPNDTMTIQESIGDHTDAVYNTVNHNTDADNYDHVGKKKLNTVDDDHYDTTFSSVKSESYYNTTNQSKTGKGEQDGTYDSTNCTDG